MRKEDGRGVPGNCGIYNSRCMWEIKKTGGGGGEGGRQACGVVPFTTATTTGGQVCVCVLGGAECKIPCGGGKDVKEGGRKGTKEGGRM